jgi:hypothetical protein
MNVAAVSAISRVAAPYPARIPMLDDTRPAWETEWAARSAAAGRGVPAAWEAQRLARAGHVPPAPAAGVAAPIVRDREAAARIAPPQPDLDALRDQYADTRMRRAVADYAAQPDTAAQGAHRANDWGTMEGLAPLQPYRVAMGNPQVELQAAAAVKAAGLGIPKVANIGATENATDNARYRPGFTP